ncbi:MAG: histidine kinase [Propionibacteriaceae bacterium]|nr:histidine kinase [Propionibacteriaceae bacterium]
MPTEPSQRRGPRIARLWGPLWRTTLVASLGFVGFIVVWMDIDTALVAGGGSLEEFAGLLVLDLLLGVTAIALYPLRHRKPLLVTVIIVAVTAVSSLAFPAAALAVVSLSTRRRRGEIITISVVFLTSAVVNLLTIHVPETPPLWLGMLMAAGLCALLVLTGLYIGGRRQLVSVLRERAESTEREHAAGIERARTAERTRIAREMHDALAHRLSLVSLHAGVLEYRTNLSPDDARTTAGIVRENAHLAARDLREVLGVLRNDDDVLDTTRPAPSILDALDDLVEDNRAAGNPTTLVTGDSITSTIESLSPPIGRHVLRVVQESLTNARKHAPGEPTQVHLEGNRGERVMVRVTNRLAADAPHGATTSGFGLTGLRERARIAGGDLQAGRRDEAFVLEAWFPWTP